MLPFKKIIFLSIILIICMSLFTIPSIVVATSVKSSGSMELSLNKEQTLILGENFEYTLELINLDACDKVLSTNFSCIPTIALVINQIDIETKEIIDSETLEHMNFGVHDLNISYSDITIVSLNVLNIEIIENRTKIEIAYKEHITQQNVLEVTTRDNINAIKGQEYSIDIKIYNNSIDIMNSTMTIDEMASSQYITFDDQQVMREQELTLNLQPGVRESKISFVPLIEGHHWLIITIDNVQKRIPVLVHSPVSVSSNVLYVDNINLEEVLMDQNIIYDIKMDSVYLLGFSFILLIFGGVLGFIKSNGFSPMKKEY